MDYYSIICFVIKSFSAGSNGNVVIASKNSLLKVDITIPQYKKMNYFHVKLIPITIKQVKFTFSFISNSIWSLPTLQLF